MARDRREAGVSTAPGEGYMDKIQESVQETGEGPQGEDMALTGWQNENSEGIQVNRDAADVIEPDDEPRQVEPATVIFVPFRDFEARINQTSFQFRKDVPTRVTRDQVNDYVSGEDKKGYIK